MQQVPVPEPGGASVVVRINDMLDPIVIARPPSQGGALEMTHTVKVCTPASHVCS
jgi:hypothetical protein